MAKPTRFPGGLNNALRNSTLSDYLDMDPTKCHQEFVDFTGLDYLASAWTVTETQAGATQSLIAADAGGEYGILRLVNTAGAADVNSIQLTTAAMFIADTSKRWWLKGRISRDNADLGIQFGVQNVDATPLVVDSGIVCRIAGAATAATFEIGKAGSLTNASIAGAYPTSALNTFVTLGMAYNGKDSIALYVNDVEVGEITTLTNLPNTAALLLSVSSTNTTANARNMDCDYVFFAVER